MRILPVALVPVVLTACGPRVIDLSGSHPSSFEVVVDEVFIIDCGIPNDQDPEVHSAHWRIPEYRDADGGFLRPEDSNMRIASEWIDYDDPYRIPFRAIAPGEVEISIPATENASSVVQDTCGALFTAR